MTEQNVQARARGLTMTAIANETGALLLATGNKSELAVGYATLYGDMAGALAPIGDVYKTDVYRIAEWINRDEELIPREIIEKAPSAELKPDQTDQDSLPPYETLDAILRLYLEENLECAEIVERVGEPDTVKRTLAMVDFNEFKRRQAAPALASRRRRSDTAGDFRWCNDGENDDTPSSFHYRARACRVHRGFRAIRRAERYPYRRSETLANRRRARRANYGGGGCFD